VTQSSDVVLHTGDLLRGSCGGKARNGGVNGWLTNFVGQAEFQRTRSKRPRSTHFHTPMLSRISYLI
jgi:hypothetical protein